MYFKIEYKNFLIFYKQQKRAKIKLFKIFLKLEAPAGVEPASKALQASV